jgi:hypothetical protein
MHAQVIDYEIDPSFDTGVYFQKGTITDLNFSGQEIIVTGNFTNLPGIANWWTNLDYWGDILYETPNQNSGASNVQPYLSKYITNGSQIAYTNNHGIVDNSFQFEYWKQAYSGFVSREVNNVLVYQDTLLLVAGVYFTDSTDISTNSLRQLCMIDGTGAPIEGFPMVKCEPFDARIYTIDTLSTGEYIIAGSFTHVNGHPTNNIAKLNADFSVDTEFGNIFGNQGSAAAIIDDNDKIWMRCSNGFLQANPNENVHFVRLAPNGLLDPTYNIATFVTYFDENSPYETGPTALLLEEDDTVILTGNFVEVNGEYHKTIVQLYDDGSIVEGAFDNLGADEAVWGNWDGGPLGPIAGTWISEMLRVEDGKILLGGQFSSFGGEPYSCLVRLQPSGFVGLNDIERRRKLKLYPNPAQNTVRFEVPDKNEKVSQIEIFDLSGRLVISQSLNTLQAVIDVSDLRRGVYLVKAKTESGVYSQKLVLQSYNQ